MDPEAALKSGNPGPEVELAFWKSKVFSNCAFSLSDRRTCLHPLALQAENLNSLHEQLSGEKIRKVIKVLEVPWIYIQHKIIASELGAKYSAANPTVRIIAGKRGSPACSARREHRLWREHRAWRARSAWREHAWAGLNMALSAF